MNNDKVVVETCKTILAELINNNIISLNIANDILYHPPTMDSIYRRVDQVNPGTHEALYYLVKDSILQLIQNARGRNRSQSDQYGQQRGGGISLDDLAMSSGSTRGIMSDNEASAAINRMKTGGYPPRKSSMAAEKVEPKVERVKGPVYRSISAPPDIHYTPSSKDPNSYTVTQSYHACSCGGNADDPEVVPYTEKALEYKKIATVSDDQTHPVNIFRLISHIPSFSIMGAVKEAAAHHSKFFDGRYIAVIDTLIYKLVVGAPPSCSRLPIDEYLIDTGEGATGGVTTNTAKLIPFIKMLQNGNNFPSPQIEPLIKNINAELLRWCRAHKCVDTLEITDLNGICKFIESSKMGKSKHPIINDVIFPVVIVNCLKRALNSMHTPKNKQSMVDMGDAINDIIKHPDFIIRENGLTDRDCDIMSAAKVDRLSKMFTIYPQRKTICYANFIPEALKADLEYDYIVLDREYNAIDRTINQLGLMKDSIDFVCQDGDDMVTYRNGGDYMSNYIIYKDELDLLK